MTSASASTPSPEDASQATAAGEPAQPKRGLLASAGERVRRALGGGRDKPKPESAAPVLPGAELDPTRTSVRALARSLLQQDRNDPAPEDAESTPEAKHAEVEEPKTIPRAKSVPPPLPKRESTPEPALPLATADEATSTPPADVAPPAAASAVSSRSAQLRARLSAAKAQLAQAQAKLLEAQALAETAASAHAGETLEESVDLETLGAVEVKTAPKMELVEAQAQLDELPESGVVQRGQQSEAASAVEAEAIDAEDGAADELDELEDLDGAELVEESATAAR